MRHKKLIKYSFIIIFIIIFLFLVSTRNNTLKENVDLKNSIINTLNNSTEIDISKLYNNDWDKLYILPPYSNITDTLSNYKISKKTKFNSNIEISDSMNLLLFIESNEIVSFLELPRDMGFLDLTSPIELNKIDTKFKIDKNTIIY